MKIKEFWIMRYGPLQNKEPILLNNFNLFFGKNEEGKTLTIDALVKLLLGRNIKDFEHINRVEENPEGYVVIEDDRNRKIKLSKKENLTKIANLTPSEYRNIFIIRNSDLSIARESEFYTNVTDRLTGLKTEEIFKIKETLREMGKVTPSGVFRDIKDEKLKTKIERSRELIEKIESLNKKIKQEKFDELEEELVDCEEEIDKIAQSMENLEDARKREKYRRGKEALNKLKKALEKIKNLEIYNEDDEELWRDYERNIKSYIEEKKALIKELEENEKEFKEISRKLSEKERDFQILSERKRKLDDEVKLELRDYEKKSEELALQEDKSKSFNFIGVISPILLGISLLGVIIRPSLLFYTLLVLFLALTIVLWGFNFLFTRRKAHLAGMFKKINLALSKFKLDAKNIERILSNIQEFNEKYSQKSEDLEKIKRDRGVLKISIEKLKEKILKIEGNIRNMGDKIEKMRRRSKEESLQNYIKKFELKQKLLEEQKEGRSILKNLFGIKGESEILEENISYWDKEIEILEEYKDKANDREYDEKIISKLKGEKKAGERKLNELKEKAIRFQKNLEEIEREVNKILQLEEDYLYCKTSIDLITAKDKLQEFINKNESTKDTALKVMKIFKEMEMEEKERISELFGKDSPVSKYFNEATDGFYEEVSFNQKIGKIEVKHKDEVLEAEKLSGGAYDQLYLSIRLALGEKLLKKGKGFFILDDPFIKADQDRLQKQIEILKRISQWGWQIIYFSAKDEIKDILKKNIDSADINYIEI